ncbi:MAG TPA: enoyl-CoA hydratase/isomerase family protein, partial [Sphingomicrobium sp.]
HYVPQSSLDELVARLAKSPGRAQGAIGAFSATAPDARIEQNLAIIARTFASDRLEDIHAALEAEQSEWAETELITLRSKSPLSCKVSLRLLAEGSARASFTEEMAAEYALAARVACTHDFVEGVRALLIDKDNNPNWQPPAPEDVTEDMLDGLFAPLPASEEWQPFPGSSSRA